MHRSFAGGLLAGPLCFIATSLSAQAELPPLAGESAALAAHAGLSADSATVLARNIVPGGTVVTRRIRLENGVLIYSISLTLPDTRTTDEINLDAGTGALIGIVYQALPADTTAPPAETRRAAPKKK